MYPKTLASFVCNECEKLNSIVFAHANVDVIDKDDKSKDFIN